MIINLTDCLPTRVAVTSVSGCPGSSRREAERASALALLRHMLDDDTAEIGHNSDGSPYVEGRPGLHISISHSRRLVAVAVDATRRVGVDIEALDRENQLRRVAARFLAPDELEVYRGRLVEAWTLKEAIYKIEGLPDFRNDILPAATDCTIIYNGLVADHRLALVAR